MNEDEADVKQTDEADLKQDEEQQEATDKDEEESESEFEAENSASSASSEGITLEGRELLHDAIFASDTRIKVLYDAKIELEAKDSQLEQ